jgi:Xaa-Pro aminopeptidase
MGYQPESCPASLADAIQRRFPALTLQQHPEIVGLLRMRKSSAELEAVRRSVAVCDAAQATVREMASAGTTEADILAAIRSTVDRLAGQDVALIHEVTSGPRSGRIGFSASDRVLRDGDLLLTDIAPQVDGYWGDSCATQPVGRPTPEGAQMLRVAGEALELGTAMVKPGALTRDVDRAMREHIGAVFPPYHNSGGHGIGLDYHEPPRLVPGEELVLEEDMVIAMEPGIYLPDVAGVRLEHVVVVTSAGCDVLSRHVLAEG